MILQASNILFVDQPIGTGFSYSSDKRDIRHNENDVSDDLYDFIQVSVIHFPFAPSHRGALVFVMLCIAQK